jgi:large conductance mechanosensitive channel
MSTTLTSAASTVGGPAKEFRDFILRGNVVDLAIGVVIGAAFGKIVTSFVADFITPLIGIFAGKIDLANYKLTVGQTVFAVGDFLNVVITFLLTALVVFFFVVKPVGRLMAMRKTETPVDPTTRECPQCLSSIPLKATRCAFCTAEVAAV